MVMTVVMLEGYIRSEVENLHLRVDQIASMRQHLNDIAESTKRQVVLIWDAIDTLRADVSFMKQNFVTKEEAECFATKDDLKSFATKNDFAGFATKDDLETRLEALFKKYLRAV